MNSLFKGARRLLPAIGLCLMAAAVCSKANADEASVTIGISAPLQIQSGRDAVDGARLAVEELNAAGGIFGRPVKLVTVDEGFDTQQAIAAVRKLISDNKPDVVIGAGYTGVALAEMSYVMQSKTLFLTVNTAAEVISERLRKNRDANKYWFRVSPLNSTRQTTGYLGLLSRLKKDWGISKIAIVGQNAKFVQDVTPAIKSGVESIGLSVVSTELFEPATTDFSPIFSRVRDHGAEFMLIFLVDANADSFVKQWYDVKLPIPIGGLDVKSQDMDFFSRIGGKAVSEIIGVISVDAPLTPKTQPFWRLFEKTYGRLPVYSAGAGYDAVGLFAAAAAQSKQLGSDHMISALEGIHYVGVAGGISFDDLHDVKDGPGGLPFPFLQWQTDGTRSIVWPPELEKGKLILPPWMEK